jgi:hypothetical protein
MITPELKDLFTKVMNGIFLKKDKIKVMNVEFRVLKFKNGEVRGFNIGPYRFLQQNMKTSSYWAKLAKQGHRIAWILKDGKYVGQLFNNTLFWKKGGKLEVIEKFR